MNMHSRDWKRSETFGESLKCALDGIAEAFGVEKNMRIQATVGLVIMFVAVLLLALHEITFVELALIFLATGLVLALEIVNTALEQLENVIHPEFHHAIKNSKDIASGAVLVASITAVLVGITILGPPILRILVY